MKRYNILHVCLSLILLLAPVSAFCATSSVRTQRQDDGDSIKLNKDFMRELEAAFSFEKPKPESFNLIAPQPLDKETLHRWVGPTTSTAAGAVSIPGLSGDALLKASFLWKKGQYGMLKDGTFSGLDVNALGKYIRPEEIKLRRLRNIAKNARADMDLLFPKDGISPIHVKKDTVVALH